MYRRTSILAGLSLASILAVTPLASAEYSGPPRILIIPFSTLNVPDNQQWVGRAVQENLIANLGKGNVYAPIAFQGQLVVEDNATATALAHKAGASFVVRGSAQMIDQSVRFTAQMIDANSGDTITTASVTGNSSDVLKLEDDLSNQLEANATAVATAQAQAQAAAATQPAPQASIAPPLPYNNPSYTPGYSYAPTIIYTAPQYYNPGYYTTPYYYNNYYSPFTIGGFGYWGGGFYRGGFGHNNDHDGDDRGGFHGGIGGGIRGGSGGFNGGGSRGGGFTGGGSRGGGHR